MNIVRLNPSPARIAIFRHRDDLLVNNQDYDLQLINDVTQHVERQLALCPMRPGFNRKLPIGDRENGVSMLSAIDYCNLHGLRPDRSALCALLSGVEPLSPFLAKSRGANCAPLIYQAGLLYFFDFFNFFAEGEPGCVSSVIIFSCNEFSFPRLVDCVGSNLEKSSIVKTFAGIRMAVQQLQPQPQASLAALCQPDQALAFLTSFGFIIRRM